MFISKLCIVQDFLFVFLSPLWDQHRWLLREEADSDCKIASQIAWTQESDSQDDLLMSSQCWILVQMACCLQTLSYNNRGTDVELRRSAQWSRN